MSSHTPGPWMISDDDGGWLVHWSATEVCFIHLDDDEGGEYLARKRADALLSSSAPDLLALAKQYASECGECAGTRVVPGDDEGRFGDVPCDECADIWLVIDAAEGRT